MITAEQVFASQKVWFETLLALSQRSLDGVEKLAALNLEVAKTSMADAAEASTAVLSAKDPQALAKVSATLFKPMGEKAAAYQRGVYEIASVTGAEFAKAAKAGAEEMQQSFMAAVDEAARNAPAGSENVVALFKSALQGATGAYEGMQKSARQMTDVAAANFNAVGETAAKATAKSRRIAA